MNLTDNLKKVGLIGSEIKVYLYLIENGLSSPAQVAKGTGIIRTNCYHVLRSLKEKGLVKEQSIGKRKAYLASDPEALLRSLETQKEAAERAIPDLRALYTIQKNKPKIRFYDGIEQLKEVYAQTLAAAEIAAIASTKDMLRAAPALFEWYGNEVKERDIVFREIGTELSLEEEKAIKNKLQWQYDYKLLSGKEADFQTDLLIWEDSVAMIAFEEPIFATVITNKTLAKTYKAVFNALWNRIN